MTATPSYPSQVIYTHPVWDCPNCGKVGNVRYEYPNGKKVTHCLKCSAVCPTPWEDEPFEFEETTKVKVRWWDGYFEEFECLEARAGAYLLWLKLADGETRHIPLNQVRWYNGLY